MVEVIVRIEAPSDDGPTADSVDNALQALGQLPIDAAGKQRLVEATPGRRDFISIFR